MCGFYREWKRNGEGSEEQQLTNMTILVDQIEKATEEDKEMIMLGDANICTQKWEDPNYKNHKVATELRNAVVQNGMINMKLGNTFMADNCTNRENVTESAIDHIYITKEMEDRTKVSKLLKSATDHLPIVAEIARKECLRKGPKVVWKRSLKGFTKEKWNESLARKRWEAIGETEDVNEMAKIFNRHIQEALDECAPVKEFKIRKNYRSGLKEGTIEMIKERDKIRKKIGKATKEEKKPCK